VTARAGPRCGCGGVWQVSQPEPQCLNVEGLRILRVSTAAAFKELHVTADIDSTSQHLLTYERPLRRLPSRGAWCSRARRRVAVGGQMPQVTRRVRALDVGRATATTRLRADGSGLTIGPGRAA
jgi:hypothetical protein